MYICYPLCKTRKKIIYVMFLSMEGPGWTGDRVWWRIMYKILGFWFMDRMYYLCKNYMTNCAGGGNGREHGESYSRWKGNMWNRSLVFSGNPEMSMKEAERRASRACLLDSEDFWSLPLE